MTFEAISFSRLIRTIIPGLLVAFVICGYIDMINLAVSNPPPILSFARKSPGVAITVILFASVFLGALSNVIVFMWATDLFIIRHFKKNHQELTKYQTALHGTLIEDAWSRANPKTTDAWSSANPQTTDAAASMKTLIELDPLYLIMPKMDLEKWQYLEESYWSFVEFQLTLCIGAFLGMPLAFWMGLSYGSGLGWPALGIWAGAVLAAVLSLALCAFLIAGARHNYSRLTRKRLSYLMALTCDD